MDNDNLVLEYLYQNQINKVDFIAYANYIKKISIHDYLLLKYLNVK